MNYNLYLFSKIADQRSEEIKNIDEIDIKWDILRELYEQYNKSSESNKPMSDHDCMMLWFAERENKRTIDKLYQKVRELRWILECVKTDAYDIYQEAVSYVHNGYSKDIIDTFRNNIEIACDPNDNECFDWKVDRLSFENFKPQPLCYAHH